MPPEGSAAASSAPAGPTPTCSTQDEDPGAGINSAYCVCAQGTGTTTASLLTLPSTVMATASCDYSTMPGAAAVVTPTNGLGPATTNTAVFKFVLLTPSTGRIVPRFQTASLRQLLLPFKLALLRSTWGLLLDPLCTPPSLARLNLSAPQLSAQVPNHASRQIKSPLKALTMSKKTNCREMANPLSSLPLAPTTTLPFVTP